MDATNRLLGAQQRNATARDDALFDRGAGCVEGVLDAILLFFHFYFCGAANTDHSNPAGELRQPFLQLFAVIIGGRFPRSAP